MKKLPDRLEPIRRIARSLPGGMATARWLRRRIDPELRSIERVRKHHGATVFQPFPTTVEERYPQLFDALAEQLAHLNSPRILSFGCASGEEVRALRLRVPSARIVGIDLNSRALKMARKRDPSPLSEYRLAAAPRIDDRFDAVLAMAVFRHGELEADRPDSCTAILTFARFAQGVATLDACLEPSGWLAIFHAHFRFGDTTTAQKYAVHQLTMSDHQVPDLFYGPDDSRLIGITDSSILWQKSAEDCS